MPSQNLIAINDAVPGMVLTASLLDAHNNVLLPGQTVLSASMIAALKRHHVNEIAIEASRASDQPEADQDAKNELKEKLERINTLFMAHEDEIINQQFKQIVIDFYVAGAA